MGACDIDHANIAGHLEGLPPSQAMNVRHVCAGCAYEKGYADGFRFAIQMAEKKLLDMRRSGLRQLSGVLCVRPPADRVRDL